MEFVYSKSEKGVNPKSLKLNFRLNFFGNKKNILYFWTAHVFIADTVAHQTSQHIVNSAGETKRSDDF